MAVNNAHHTKQRRVMWGKNIRLALSLFVFVCLALPCMLFSASIVSAYPSQPPQRRGAVSSDIPSKALAKAQSVVPSPPAMLQARGMQANDSEAGGDYATTSQASSDQSNTSLPEGFPSPDNGGTERGAETIEGRGEAARGVLVVHASLVVISPGEPIYSVFGHSALRMECPTYGLDYCFSFENEPTFDYYLRFFAGQANAAFVAVPTKEFLSTYQKEGRGVTQYELNLTLHEKQELWRALDNDMVDGAHRKFNLLQNNCTSMALTKIESILFNEELDFGRMPEQMYYKNGRGIKWLSRRSPWAQFVFMGFTGSEADTDWTYEQKLSPELVVPVLKGATIVNKEDGSRRSVLIGQPKTLLPLRHVPEASPITPVVAFLALLFVAVVITVAQWRGRWNKVAKVFDVTLFTLQTVIGVFLLYVTAVAGLFGYHWNWLLIPLNPLPFILWLCLRKRPIYNKVWPLYTLVLVAFIAIVPWITIQLQPAHYLMVATLAVRCAAHARHSVVPTDRAGTRPAPARRNGDA